MTIRQKLILVYGVLLVALLALGLLYYNAMSRWRHAASELSNIHRQNELAEQLRAGIQGQVNRTLDFLEGDREAQADIRRLEALQATRLADLEELAVREGERDHLEGLTETWLELEYTVSRVMASADKPPELRNLEAARSRLRDIAAEVAEDVAVLNQFYRSEVDADIRDASRAGRYAEVATGAAVVVALLQLALLIFLSQRWLVRPIAQVGEAATRISTGDFDTRVHLTTGEEWSKLSLSINHMASSLAYQRQMLVGRERLATLGEAAAYTAHNIRNPLAAIRMTAQVTRDELTSGQEPVREPLTDIIHTVDRLEAWARRFLEFARPFELHTQAADVNLLLSRTAELVNKKFASGSTQIQVNLDRSLPDVAVDSLLLEQALAALITNAFEAGGSLVRVETRLVSVAGTDPRLDITIDDDGKGIPLELQARLFRAFVSDKPGGTGLGLAQTRTIIELHGGHLALESAPGRGTRVTIDLPLSKPSTDGGTHRTA